MAKNPAELGNQIFKLKPRDDSYTKGMNDFHAKRKALLDSKDPDAYLGPQWNQLSDEIKKFRAGYEPAKVYSPREYLLDNDIDEFQIDRVSDDISLEDIWNAMQKGEDFYTKASVDGKGFDSAVREKIFEGMADKLGLDYDDIYYQWLGKPRPKVDANGRYVVDNGNPNRKTDPGEKALDELNNDPKYWASRVLQDPGEYSKEELAVAQFIANKWK